MKATDGVHSVKLKKLKRAILYSFDGENWVSFFDGTEEETSNTWMYMQAGFCNDDLCRLIAEHNRSLQNNGK